MGKWRSKLYQTDRAGDFDHERDRKVRARQVYETIDRQPFQWIVVLVAGTGFFLDGYTLFASNIALPMIAYVYWNGEVSHDKLAWINMATIAGTMLGQLSFGVLADQKGRKKMYGMELIVLIVSTLGVAMASTGSHNSMSIFGWLVAWRFVTGVSVGADYPLSSVITSEFSPTVHRARMMATVFFMQPLGQIACTLTSMATIVLTRRSHGSADLTRSVDIMWRWIIGIGVVPGILAMIFRFAIPETPRFMLEIEDDPVKAEFDATALFGNDDEQLVSPTPSELETGLWALDTNVSVHRPATSIASKNSLDNAFSHYYDNDNNSTISPSSIFATADWTLATPTLPSLNSKWSVTRKDLYQYFIREKNWITLACVSMSWLIVDFGFYGVGLSTPHFLAKTWGSLNINGLRPTWQTTDDPTVSIYDEFLSTSVHALVILNLGSILGSILLILTINHLNRVTLQRYGFLVLAACFVATGSLFLTDARNREGPVAITLYIIIQTVFNFGPNATTYILPAELFPTRYRATCHGIAAASGKLGTVLMQLMKLSLAHRARNHMREHQATGSVPLHRDFRGGRYGEVLIGFGIAMVLGFVVTLWIPNVQDTPGEVKKTDGPKIVLHATLLQRIARSVKREVTGMCGRGLKSKSLEDLSLGRAGVRSESIARKERSTWI